MRPVSVSTQCVQAVVHMGQGRRQRGRSHRHVYESVSNEQMPLPVQYQATWEMTSALNSRHAGHNLLYRLGDQFSDSDSIFSAQPFLVCGMHIDWAVEDSRPC